MTPKGTAHAVFLIIADGCPYDSSELAVWPLNSLPSWAQGPYNDIIDSTGDQIGTVHNLTEYYYKMSNEDLTLTGEFFPEVMKVPCDTFTDGESDLCPKL